MLRTIKVLVTLLSFTAGAVQAESEGSRLYYGLEIGNGKFDVSKTVEDTMQDIGGAFGYNIARFLAVEARVGVASNDKNSLVGDSEVTRGSVLLKLQYSGDHVIAYIAGGAGVLNTDISGTSSDDDGVVASVGVELFGTDRTALSLSYTNHERKKAKLDYTVANIGFRHYFGTQF
jgi:hypothetical protein